MKDKTTKEPRAVSKKSKKQQAIEKAKKFTETKLKSVVGQVQNADPEYVYYYFDRDGLDDGREKRLRFELEAKGYEESHAGEYVVGCRAVVYKIPQEAYDVLFQERCRKAEERLSRLEHAKKKAKREDALGALQEAILEADPEVVDRLKGLLT
tara:strand:- start:147 stop:605 length:459 start_codon:yes stop_codon:yes gene_type:complete